MHARQPEGTPHGRFFASLIPGAMAYFSWVEVADTYERGGCFIGSVVLGLALLFTAATFWTLTGREGSG
mgnify:CR=1 FL=1